MVFEDQLGRLSPRFRTYLVGEPVLKPVVDSVVLASSAASEKESYSRRPITSP